MVSLLLPLVYLAWHLVPRSPLVLEVSPGALPDSPTVLLSPDLARPAPAPVTERILQNLSTAVENHTESEVYHLMLWSGV